MNQITELSDEQLDVLANKIVVKLTKEQQEEFKKMRKYAFHNTRLLLRKYDVLKAHVETIDDQLTADQETFWNHKYLTLSALMQNRAKTVKIMRHVTRGLDEYERLCKKKDSRGYKLLEKKYFGIKMNDEMIAEYYGVDRTTINRQIKDATNELSEILYGVEALELK
ncbi:hypothetical protein [Enterococcus sp. 5H]|uniref:hypothetical protein n=1 Tax=Enterococcus sp. 5H TaxID=1229490 RepID=UPI0023034C5F|nr:hypothetical protein [Enterococcus sp. 5H]MDA9472062.1 hypothetical protein [Enterococcus sp. 5H]